MKGKRKLFSVDNYIVKNIIFFIVALISSNFFINIIQGTFLNSRNADVKHEKLDEINKNFQKRLIELIESKFVFIDYLSDTTYPEIAISFDMHRQFYDLISNMKFFNDNFNICILSPNGKILSNNWENKKPLNLSAKKLELLLSQKIQKTDKLEGLYVIGDQISLVRKIGKNSVAEGFIAGLLSVESLASFIENEYKNSTLDYYEFAPSAKVFFSENPNTPIASIQFEGSNSIGKLFIINFYSLTIALIISVIFIILFSYLLQRSLKKPIDDLSRIIRIGAKQPEMLCANIDISILPKDAIFKNLSLKYIALHKERMKYEKQARDQENYHAIFKTTQMLAHDVRKPFTMLKGLLMLFQNTLNPAELREMANEFLPDVQKAITEVNGMIDDVMEIGRTATLQAKPVNPEVIIKDSLKEICRSHPKADIHIQHEYNHEHMLMVDRYKIQRVFSNIIGNAFQAMNYQGVIWFKSNEDTNRGLTTFCIGNSGSYLSEDDMPRLFDAFFSKNKAHGTGLGLAIAKKNILAHGGKIWCKSSEQKKVVEFFFTLPISRDIKKKKAVMLPSMTKELLIDFYKKHDDDNSIGVSDPRRPFYEKSIKEYTEIINRKIKLGIVDDEIIYQNALKELVNKSAVLKTTIDVHIFNCSGDLFESFKHGPPDLFICDIDLGANSLDGFQIAEKLIKDNSKRLPVCIHSNRSLAEDYERAIRVGAQAFLPKPMTREHLIKFIYDTLPHHSK